MVEEEAQKQTRLLMDAFIRENPNAERYVKGIKARKKEEKQKNTISSNAINLTTT